jgi:hypothetical protein
MAVRDRTYGHLLQKGASRLLSVHVKVARVPLHLLEIITSVSRVTMALLSFHIDFTPVHDPLWDGAGCESEGSCCSTAPWFTVDLVGPTSDDIEVRICSNNAESEEDTPILLIQLYVQ